MTPKSFLKTRKNLIDPEDIWCKRAIFWQSKYKQTKKFFDSNSEYAWSTNKQNPNQSDAVFQSEAATAGNRGSFLKRCDSLGCLPQLHPPSLASFSPRSFLCLSTIGAPLTPCGPCPFQPLQPVIFIFFWSALDIIQSILSSPSPHLQKKKKY